MLEQSDAVKQAWQATDRTLDIVINVDGTDYQATSINSLSYDAGAFTGDSLGIGSTYENSISAEFASVIETFAAGQVVKPQIGIKVDGAFEYTPLGVFIISEVNRDRNNNITTIKALDQMVKLERAYTSTLTYPAAMLDVVAEIANQGGVTVNQTDLTHLPNLPKLNSAITGQTLRTAIGWIAQFYAGFAAFDRSGQLTIRTTATPDYVINPSEYMQGGLTKNEVTYKTGGIKVSVTTTSTTETGEQEDKTTTLQAGETSGSQIELVNNVMTNDALSTIWTSIKDISFYPYSLNWFGNPALEAGDWVTLTDTQGNKFNAPVNQLTFTFNGGLESTISANQASQSSTVMPWTGPTQNAITQAITRKMATGNNVYDPSFTEEPKNAKIGDVWFKQNGNNVELWTYSRDSSGNASWQKQAVDGEEKAQVEKATNEAKAYSDSVKAQLEADAAKAKAELESGINAAKATADNITNYVQNSSGSSYLATFLSQSASNASLSALVNGQVVSAINVSSSGDTLIAGKKIMLDGDVAINGTAFANKLKATGITVDQLVAGNIDASKINVINLNANNITAGTINGSNLSINLDNGQVAFTKGSLHSTDGMFNIDLDNKSFKIQPNNDIGLWIDNNGLHYKSSSTSDLWINNGGFHSYTSGNPNGTWIKDDSLTNADAIGQGVTFQKGNIQFSSLPYWSNDSSKVYGTISRDDDLFSASKDGLRITGRDGVTISSDSCDANSLLTNTYGPLVFHAGSGLGLSDDVNRASCLYSNSTLYLSAGRRYPLDISGHSGLDAQPTISVGTGEYYRHSGTWMYIPSDHDNLGNSVSVHAANFNVAARDFINFEAQGGDGRIVFQANYIYMYPTYIKTTSAGANVYVAADGSLVRSTSAAKYKTDIQPANEFVDYGDKLINLTPKVWLDKAEVKRYKDDPDKNKKPGYYYGLIADELDQAGLNKLVTYGADGQVEGIQYDRLAVALLPIIKKLKEDIKELKERILK